MLMSRASSSFLAYKFVLKTTSCNLISCLKSCHFKELLLVSDKLEFVINRRDNVHVN